MLLKELSLRNIRSYPQGEFSFPEGLILLSGDIGSGKSSLLQAMEFALFGTSRPDLPAEALLRKGTTQGEVRLKFQMEDKEVTIQRNLKKEKDGIKQTSGYIIVNNIKKELTAIELKAEIISLLGYPEDQLLKNKNYLFRFTVYCPQEEMRSILQEDAESRLDTLRKIFNLDKYKIIRENLQIYLKELRTRMAVLSTRVEEEPAVQLMLQKVEEELIKTGSAKQEQEQQMQALVQQRSQAQERLGQLEKEQRKYQELRHLLHTARAVMEEKKTLRTSLIEQEEQGQAKLLSFPQEVAQEQVEAQLHRQEQEREQLWKKRTALQEKIRQGEKNSQEIDAELKKMKEELTPESSKRLLVQLLKTEVEQKKKQDEKLEQLEELLQRTVSLIIKNEQVLQQSKELREKIGRLEQCPTCRQDVSASHKEHIAQQEEEKVAKAENLLFEYTKSQSLIQQQREEAQQKKQELAEKEKALLKTEWELGQLEMKKKESQRKEELLRLARAETTQARQEAEEIKEERIQELEQSIGENRKIMQVLLQRNQLRQRQEELRRSILLLQEQMRKAELQEQQLLAQLHGKQDASSSIVEQKKHYEELAEKEKKCSQLYGQLAAQVEYAQKQKEEAMHKLEHLRAEKSKLIRQKEIYQWIEQHLLNLTYTIEKHILVQIHHLFNQLFREWFALLLDDETMNARVDDSFYPIVEQNGYEIAISNLSGGEKTSAALAYRLALNKVINDIMHNIKTKDLLILDEPTDGFSSEQLDKVREVLERINLKQVVIVSHESKIESFVDHVIRIGKEEMVSRIVE